MNKIKDCNDILLEISGYLNFEDKINFGKYCNKNLTKYYNFQTYNLSRISDIFTIFDNDEYIDYIYGDMCSSFVFSLEKACNDYYGYDMEDFMNDYYNDISRENYRILSDLFRESYIDVYTRKLLENIENSNKLIKYNCDENIFELDLFWNIDEIVKEYYMTQFENENISCFCKRCGSFGHHDVSNECVFYNKSYEKKQIRKNVRNAMNDLLLGVIYIDKEEKRRIAREPLLCVICKANNKLSKCIQKCCGSCCNDDECIHFSINYKKNMKREPLCCKCKKNNKHTKCKNYSCRSCCNDNECIIHKRS